MPSFKYNLSNRIKLQDFAKLIKTIPVLDFVLLVLCFSLIFESTLAFGFKIDRYLIRSTLADVAIFVLLCGYFSRRIGLLYAAFWAMLGIAYAPVGELYGLPDQNAIESALNTDLSEALGFLSMAPVTSYIKMGLILILFILIFVLILNQKNHFSSPVMRKGAWLVLVGMTAMSAVKAISNKDWQFMEVRLNEVKISNTFLDAYRKIDKNNQIRSLFALNSSWKLSPVMGTRIPDCDICVLVMGESVRRDFLGVYGAPWDNTPWMSKSPGLLFENYLSASQVTISSLGISLFAPTFSSLAPWGDNIITLAKKAGYYTSWISIQTQHSDIDTPISKVGDYADYVKYVHQEVNYDQRDDRDLLPYFKETLKNKSKKHFIFLHLYNSHPVVCDRTKGEYKEWFMSKELSCYIETVRRTDELLSVIQNLLKNKTESNGLKWGMLYMADHGLGFYSTPDGYILRHLNNTSQQAFEPPFFITGSGWKEKRAIKSRRSGIYLTQIIGAWLGYDVSVDEGRYTNGHADLSNCDWFADVPCERQNLIKPFDRDVTNINAYPSYSLKDFIREPKADGAF